MLKHITLLYLLTFAALLSYGQGFQVNLQGQVQQGMASAGTALPVDAASLFFNPGGSAFVHGQNIQIGVTPTIPKGTFLESGTDEIAHTNSPVSTPFTAYGLFEIRDSSKLKLGLAAYTPFGSTVSYEDGWTGRFALTRLQLLSIFVQPTISYRISDKIGIGAGFIYAYGKVNLQKDLPILDQNGDYGHVELAGTGQGFGFNAGVHFDILKEFKVGITYRSQVNMQLNNGTANFDVPTSLDANFPDGGFKGSLPLPQVITLGLASDLNKWQVALDINYVGWKAYDTLAFDYELNTSSLEDTKSAREYKNIMAFRLGAQYAVSQSIQLRAGLGYGISPVQNGYVTPETPDANRINYTLGIGYNWQKKLFLDASFLYTSAERTDTNYETNLSGTFKTRVFAPGLSISYRF